MSLSEKIDQLFETEFAFSSTSIQKDLYVNFKKLMTESPLPEDQRLMALLALSQSLKQPQLKHFAIQELKEKNIAPELIQEAQESAAIMGLLNTYYKFKSYLSDEAKELYLRAGLRMQSLMKPVTGKEVFEKLSLAISVVNGCPSCIASHERALIKLNVAADEIHDLARLAAVCKGLQSLKD